MIELTKDELNQIIDELEICNYSKGVVKLLTFLYVIRDDDRKISTIGIREKIESK